MVSPGCGPNGYYLLSSMPLDKTYYVGFGVMGWGLLVEMVAVIFHLCPI